VVVVLYVCSRSEAGSSREENRSSAASCRMVRRRVCRVGWQDLEVGKDGRFETLESSIVGRLNNVQPEARRSLSETRSMRKLEIEQPPHRQFYFAMRCLCVCSDFSRRHS
jgi:hypothetical protein